jgi:hypothetical protein
MARETGKLVRVERKTASGATYFEKVRQPSKNKAVEPDTSGAPVTSPTAGRQTRTKA